VNQPLFRETPSAGKPPSERTLASQAVFWCGIAFVGLFLVNTAAVILPPALLQPAWQLNVALSLQSNGLQALLGTAMLATSPFLDPDNLRLNVRAELIRRIAAWVCVGWLLLILPQTIPQVFDENLPQLKTRTLARLEQSLRTSLEEQKRARTRAH
jgi:hypothetical protein